MADGAGDVQSLLHKMAKPAGGGRATALQALAMPLRRAAETAAELDLQVTEVTQVQGSLTEGLQAFEASDLIFALGRGGAPVGAVAVDNDLLLALVEVQTIGSFGAAPSDVHQPTSADAALTAPLLETFLALATAATPGSKVDSLFDGMELHPRLATPRVVELTLTAGDYTCLSLSCRYGERSGALRLLLPPPPAPVEETPAAEKWRQSWSPAINRIPARLEAVLHRMRVPLTRVDAFEPGMVLPLTGATVADLKLETCDGRHVTRARLGQSNGHRAIRVEAPPSLSLGPLDTGGADGDQLGLGGPDCIDVEPSFDVDEGVSGFEGDSELGDMVMGGEFDAPMGGNFESPDMAGGGLPDVGVGGDAPDFGGGDAVPDFDMGGLDTEASPDFGMEENAAMPEAPVDAPEFGAEGLGEFGADSAMGELDALGEGELQMDAPAFDPPAFDLTDGLNADDE